MPERMTIWALREFGAADNFERAEAPVPALKPGHVLIRGVGHLTLQLAKLDGAEVTVVDTAGRLDVHVRSGGRRAPARRRRGSRREGCPHPSNGHRRASIAAAPI